MIAIVLGVGGSYPMQLGAQADSGRAFVVQVGLAGGPGFLQRSGRELTEYFRGVQNAARSLRGRSFSASAGMSLGSHIGLLAEYTLWHESQGESYRSVFVGPTLRLGGANALLARVAIGRVGAPVTEEWVVDTPFEPSFYYEVSRTSGFGGQVSSGIERVLWPGAALQVLMQWTTATLPDRLGRPIRYEYGAIRVGGVVSFEPRRLPH